MSVFIELSVLALRPLTGVALNVAGLGAGQEAAGVVTAWLGERFTNHGDKIIRALRHANVRAWKTLEMALGGEGLLATLGGIFHRADQKAMAEEVRRFLDEISPSLHQGQGADFRRRCLGELAAARAAKLLEDSGVDLKELARASGRLAKYSRPEELLTGDLEALGRVRLALPQQNYPSLRQLLELGGARDGSPLLAEAARYFFRRQVERDEELFRGLSFSLAQAASSAQTQGFQTLETALDQWGEEITDALQALAGRVEEIHDNVLDIQAALRQASAGDAASYELLKEINYRLQRQGMYGEVTSQFSFSIRTDAEKQAVKSLLRRFRELPGDQQDKLPAALNGLGKLLVGAGDFQEARQAFAEVAGQLDADTAAAAEAHHNAYRAALEQRQWDDALAALRQAVQLNPARFSPFPTEKYQIQRIVGAGGFGVAFLCRDAYMDEPAVIKSLYADDLERGIDDIFAEVKVLRRLRHPNIIGVSNCDFAASGKQRPYFVMDYFEGQSLQAWLDQNGTMELHDLLAIAIPAAEALQAAHAQNVLHRDIKPDNLLVRAPSPGTPGERRAGGQDSWQVRLIDFGLALRQQTVRESIAGGGLGQSVLGSSVAGTMEYAPPEQMGRLAAKPGPYSDIYSFAKLCCRALFGTTDPRRRHLSTLPQPLADLLDSAMEQTPADRPQGFDQVLAVLRGTDGQYVAEVPAAPPRLTPRAVVPPPIPPPAVPRKIGDTWTNPLGMKFAYIPAGEFLMGSPASEPGRFANETQHRVRISKPFLMGVYPVTQGQWKAIMGTTAAQQRDKADPQWNLPGEGDDYPIYCVNWDEAVEFCRKLGEGEGRPYRLPTEAQWEYACRAGTKGPYSGAGCLDDMGWCADNSGNNRINSTEILQSDEANYGDRLVQNGCRTHPVGQKKANAWALHDVHGNVWEWCSDWYAEEYPHGDAADPAGPKQNSDTTSRVLRGGSWLSNPPYCRCAYRNGLTPDFRFGNSGFRVCLDF